MIRKKQKNFLYYAPQASLVCVAGTFNGWQEEALVLKKDRKGYWKGKITLPEGCYEYRFQVDGIWQNDPNAKECIPNAFGTWNNIFEIR